MVAEEDKKRRNMHITGRSKSGTTSNLFRARCWIGRAQLLRARARKHAPTPRDRLVPVRVTAYVPVMIQRALSETDGSFNGFYAFMLVILPLARSATVHATALRHARVRREPSATVRAQVPLHVNMHWAPSAAVRATVLVHVLWFVAQSASARATAFWHVFLGRVIIPIGSAVLITVVCDYRWERTGAMGTKLALAPTPMVTSSYARLVTANAISRVIIWTAKTLAVSKERSTPATVLKCQRAV